MVSNNHRKSKATPVFGRQRFVGNPDAAIKDIDKSLQHIDKIEAEGRYEVCTDNQLFSDVCKQLDIWEKAINGLKKALKVWTMKKNSLPRARRKLKKLKRVIEKQQQVSEDQATLVYDLSRYVASRDPVNW